MLMAQRLAPAPFLQCVLRGGQWSRGPAEPFSLVLIWLYEIGLRIQRQLQRLAAGTRKTRALFSCPIRISVE
jgi:hypothetical protein